jgi:hypothetical protein
MVDSSLDCTVNTWGSLFVKISKDVVLQGTRCHRGQHAVRTYLQDSLRCSDKPVCRACQCVTGPFLHTLTRTEYSMDKVQEHLRPQIYLRNVSVAARLSLNWTASFKFTCSLRIQTGGAYAAQTVKQCPPGLRRLERNE